MLFRFLYVRRYCKICARSKCICLKIICPLSNIPNLVNLLETSDHALNSTTLGANGTVVRERERDRVGS